MLELRVSGDEHPKTFTLVTDDKGGELGALSDAGAGDLSPAFNDADLRAFQTGFEIPADDIGEWQDVLEAAGFDEAAAVIEEQRELATRELEDQMSGGEE